MMVQPDLRCRSVSLRRSRARWAALLVLLVGQASHAQSVWNNASGGNWGNPANWDNGNVPDNAGESAIILPPGPYTVFLDNNYNVNFLTISHVLARVDLQNTLTLGLAGGFDGAGTFTINNAGGPNSTSIRVLNSQNWIGSGKVVLNANASNLDTAYIYFNGGGEVVTLASGKEILGTGRIYVSVANNGGIVANVAGRVLELLGVGKTNNNEIAAIGGGVLQVSGITINQGPSGFFRAFTGSTVSFANATINGGAIGTDLGGTTSLTATNVFNGVATSGAVSIENNSQLQLVNALTNSGEIFLNSGSGTNQTYIRVNNSLALSGTGKLTLRADPSSLDTAYVYFNGGGEILTQAASHTIRGTGNLYVAIDNNGLIDANVPGRVLRLTSVTKSNNGTIAATLGKLEIDGTTINQTGSGVLSLGNIGGASMTFRGSTIGGGLIQSVGNIALFEAGNTLSNVSLQGPMQVANNSELRLTGAGTLHSGDLFVNSGDGLNGTYIRVVQNHNLAGSGRIVLRAHTSTLDTAYITYNGGGEILAQSSTHSIVGTGRIFVIVENAGLVSANVAGRMLELTGPGKSNSGTMNALNGGILQFNGTALTQSGAGAARASGAASILRVHATSVTSGLLEGVSGGFCEFTGSSTLRGVTFNGSGGIPNNNELRIDSNTFTNNGTLTINQTAGPNNTYLRIVSSRTINGSGTIVLNANSGNLDTAHIIYNGGGEVLTQAPSHTIRGSGNIYVAMENNGTVRADLAGRTLGLVGFPKTNNAIMRAASGGTLRTANATINQSPAGKFVSDTGGKLVFSSAVINGGTIQSNSNALSDAALFNGSTTVDSVALVGSAALENNSELRVTSGGIVNNSVLTINATGAANTTYLRVVSSATISGTGSIVLNSVGGNLDTAYLIYNGGGETLTLGQQQTLAGTGNIYVRTVSNGVVSPGGNNGSEIGRLNLPGYPFTQNQSGSMKFDLGGPNPAEFDRITGNAPLGLAGHLVPSIVGNYDPPLGQTWDIIDGPAVSGAFFTVAPGFGVEYFPTKVRITYVGPTCPSDLNHDDVVDDADFSIFAPAYNTFDCADPTMPPACPSDLNRDGVVDDADFLIFVAQYNNFLCPES